MLFDGVRVVYGWCGDAVRSLPTPIVSTMLRTPIMQDQKTVITTSSFSSRLASFGDGYVLCKSKKEMSSLEVLPSIRIVWKQESLSQQDVCCHKSYKKAGDAKSCGMHPVRNSNGG